MLFYGYSVQSFPIQILENRHFCDMRVVTFSAVIVCSLVTTTVTLEHMCIRESCVKGGFQTGRHVTCLHWSGPKVLLERINYLR
jgi:hypothetical protein